MAPLFSIGLISGIVMFITGFILNYKINRRRFYRRTITGLEVFRSYEHSWSTRLFERIGKLIAILLIIAGFMLILGSLMLPSRIK